MANIENTSEQLEVRITELRRSISSCRTITMMKSSCAQACCALLSGQTMTYVRR